MRIILYILFTDQRESARDINAPENPTTRESIVRLIRLFPPKLIPKTQLSTARMIDIIATTAIFVRANNSIRLIIVYENKEIK